MGSKVSSIQFRFKFGSDYNFRKLRLKFEVNHLKKRLDLGVCFNSFMFKYNLIEFNV